MERTQAGLSLTNPHGDQAPKISPYTFRPPYKNHPPLSDELEHRLTHFIPFQWRHSVNLATRYGAALLRCAFTTRRTSLASRLHPYRRSGAGVVALWKLRFRKRLPGFRRYALLPTRPRRRADRPRHWIHSATDQPALEDSAQPRSGVGPRLENVDATTFLGPWITERERLQMNRRSSKWEQEIEFNFRATKLRLTR